MKTLIWDFDGTLGYRTGRWSGALLDVIQEEYPDFPVDIGQIRAALQGGFPWHEPEIPHIHIRSADQWWEMLYPVLARAFVSLGVGSTDAIRFAHQARANYTAPANWALFDDVLPGLEQLSHYGWRHLILSNHVPELADIVAHLGLSPHIDALFNSAEIGYEKPHPMAFQIVLDTLSPESEAWMIGDNIEADIFGAMRAGLQAILLRKSHPEAPHCCNGIEAVVATLRGNEQK